MLHRRIPNRALLAGCFLIIFMRLGFEEAWPWLAHFASGAFVLFAFGLVAWIWPAAVGMGDVKLLALLAFALGVRPFVLILTIASLSALLLSLFLMLSKRAGVRYSLPFAPHLTYGLFVVLLCEKRPLSSGD